MSVYKIEKLLTDDCSFRIGQTFGYPFVDFKISDVGSTFESLIDSQDTFVPSLERLYDEFMTNHGNQFSNKQKLNKDIILEELPECGHP